MIGHVVGAVALVAVVAAGGTIWLLVRDERGRSRASSARALRRLTGVSAVVVLVTVVFVRPWYWDLAIAALVAGAFLGVHGTLGVLEHRASPASWGVIAVAMASVVLGSGLVALGGTAAVIDGAALLGGKPVPVAHSGQVLAHPVLYQVFWGPAWESHGTTAALSQAAAFERALPTSQWGSAVVGSGFGVGSLRSGGCWVDPAPPAPSGPASSMSSGPFSGELRRVFDGHTRLVPCPGFSAATVPSTLAPDAVVALWLDPAVPYQLGGVSTHSSLPWPGHARGLVAAGFTGGFALWGQPSCARSPACRSLPSFAAPTYALAHEFVEAITNPFGQGWFADAPLQWSARYFLSHGPTSLLGTAPAFEGEVADLCQPGQPDAPHHEPVATLGRQHFAVAAFYRPGTGCVS